MKEMSEWLCEWLSGTAAFHSFEGTTIYSSLMHRVTEAHIHHLHGAEQTVLRDEVTRLSHSLKPGAEIHLQAHPISDGQKRSRIHTCHFSQIAYARRQSATCSLKEEKCKVNLIVSKLFTRMR